MSPEVPLQYDFTGDLVDNRTYKQKRLARQANGWQQTELFSQRDVAQFGVRVHAEMPAIAQNGKPLTMVLEIEDPRSEEEKKADRQYEIERKTPRMFREHPQLYVVAGPDARNPVGGGERRTQVVSKEGTYRDR